MGGASEKIDHRSYVIADSMAAAEAAIEAGSLSVESPDAASEAEQPPRGTSLFRYAPAALVLISVIVDRGQFTDPDLWGHLHFGQVALARGHLVRADAYSYSALGHLWRNHEWLTEIVMGGLYNALGLVGLKLWKFACAVATVVLIAMGLAETEAEPDIQLCTLAVAALSLMPQFEFRPQIFTFALFAAVLAILARDNYRGSAPLWMLPIILALWANLHGGFIMGIAAIGVYTTIVGVDDFSARRGLNRAVRLGAITLASILSTLITPYGLGTWYTVARALGNPLTRKVVTDWRPLLVAMHRQATLGWSGEIFFLLAIVLMAAAVIGVLLSADRRDLPLAGIAFITTIAAFMAVRNMPLAVIACVLPVARHASVLRRRYMGANQLSGSFAPAHSRVAAIGCLVGAAALALGGGIFSPRLRTDQHYPAEALAFMRAHHIRGNLLDDFNWGEYLIWHAPGCKVFIDGRYDTSYPMKTIRDYLSVYLDRPGALQVLASYPHDLALFPPDAPAVALLERTPGWTLIYRDKYSDLFARADSPAARIPGIPITGATPTPPQYFP